jgi:hypothetical protein
MQRIPRPDSMYITSPSISLAVPGINLCYNLALSFSRFSLSCLALKARPTLLAFGRPSCSLIHLEVPSAGIHFSLEIVDYHPMAAASSRRSSVRLGV